MRPNLRRTLLSLLIVVGGAACHDTTEPLVVPAVRSVEPGTVGAGVLTLPNRAASVKFAVIGDSGRGNAPQYEVAAQMVAFRRQFPYAFVLMLGDNIYEGPATDADFAEKFEKPYRALLDDGVKFYAVLGNHDDPREVSYPLFNMEGERYYQFSPPEDLLAKLATRVAFFALDSTNLDGVQLQWLDERLGRSEATWKICFFHHPLYTSGRYSMSSRAYRWTLEPLLIRRGVNVAFSGHEHIYQRTELQNGILYFVSGGAGSLRPGDGLRSSFIARTFASDYHFMLVEIAGRQLWFQAVSRAGRTIDAGTLFQDAHDAERHDPT
jgi:hypothetical protein